MHDYLSPLVIVSLRKEEGYNISQPCTHHVITQDSQTIDSIIDLGALPYSLEAFEDRFGIHLQEPDGEITPLHVCLRNIGPNSQIQHFDF